MCLQQLQCQFLESAARWAPTQVDTRVIALLEGDPTSTTWTRASSKGAVKSPNLCIPFLSPSACDKADPKARAASHNPDLLHVSIAQHRGSSRQATPIIDNTVLRHSVQDCLQHPRRMRQSKCAEQGLLLMASVQSNRKEQNKTQAVNGLPEISDAHRTEACSPMSSFVWWSSIQVSPSAWIITLKRPCEANCCTFTTRSSSHTTIACIR